MNYNELTEKVIDIVQRSGILVTNVSSQDSIKEKGMANFVTYLDLEIQDYLVGSLTRIFPSARVIAEESERNPDVADGFYWVVDPIDGTTNLIHGYPHFCTSISLLKDSEPIIGITYNPITKELFRAQKDQGAFLNDKKVTVSNNGSLRTSILGFGFPYDKTKTLPTIDLLKKAIFRTQDLRRTGSAALDLAYVACGRIDGFFEYDLEIWDYAAGSLLIKEAGGKISDWNDTDLKFHSKTNITASNKLIHGELLELVG